MGQVVLDLSLSDPQHLRQLKRRESRAGQQFDDALALGALERQHGRHGRREGDEKPGLRTWSLKIVFAT